jgi:hypothetical protein
MNLNELKELKEKILAITIQDLSKEEFRWELRQLQNCLEEINRLFKITHRPFILEDNNERKD